MTAQSKPKWRFAACLFSFVLLSCVPQRLEAQAEIHETNVPSSFAHSFQESLGDGLHGGLKLSFDSFVLEANGKGDAVNHIEAGGGHAAIHLGEGISLHSLDFDLHLPLSYHGVNRGLDLTLNDDSLYFSIENLDDPSSYSFAYKVDLTPYDSPVGMEESDPLTGGIYQFEYGELDYLIDNILTILTDGENLSTPKLESSSLKMDEILASLEEIEETTLEDRPYFIWNLPLGEKTIPLGFLSDGSYSLKGIDLPAKGNDGSQASYSLKDGVSLKLSSSILPLEDSYSFAPSKDEGSYYPLINSTAIFEKIARYAKSKKFSLKAYRDSSLQEEGLLLSHHEDAYVSQTEKNYEEIDESLIAKIEANVDFEDGLFHNLGAKIDLNGESSHQYIDLHILDSSGYEGYLDLNGILKANTNKAVLDGLIANIGDFANDSSIANANLNELFGSISSAGSFLDDVMNSEAVKGFQEGTYSGLISGISRLEGGDDILVEIDTASFGLSGALDLVIEGELSHLAAIRFEGFALGGFTFSGVLIIDSYEEDGFDPSGYTTLSHLPGISEQIGELFGSKSASFSLMGYVLDSDKLGGEPDSAYLINGNPINQLGFSFSGSASFNLVEKLGGGSLKIVDRKEGYTNDHHLSLYVEGPESEEEKLDESDDWDPAKTSQVSNMLFSYDSKNDSVTNADGKHPRTNPESNEPIVGRFSIHSLDGILDVISNLLGSSDQRISSFFEDMISTSTTSLIQKLQNRELAPLATNCILVDASLGAIKDHFELSKDLLGTAENIELNLYYQNADSGLSAIEFQTTMANNKNEPSKLIYAKITIDDLSTPTSQQSLASSHPGITSLIEKRNQASTYDLSSIKTLLEYLAGSMTIGEDQNGTNSYHLGGTVSLSLGITVNLDAWIQVQGRQIKAFGNLDLPILATGVNSPLSLQLLGGHRYTSFYYHKGGSDKDGGKIYIRRVDIYTDKLNALTHQVRMSGSQFKNDMVGWIVEYMLGINSSLLNISNLSSESKSIHFEDVLKSFSYSKPNGKVRWDFGLDVGKLAHTDMLGTLTGYITGRQANVGDKKEKTLDYVHGELGLNFLLDGILTATIDLSLKNVESGTYLPCWDDQAKQYYITSKKVLFVTTYSLNTETNAVSSYYDNRFYNSQTNTFSSSSSYYGGAIETGEAANYY